MSRIGKKEIAIPAGVEVKLDGSDVHVTGPKGKLSYSHDPRVVVASSDGRVVASIPKDADRKVRALWGTTRAIINNMISGVTSGFEKKLEVIGVGYRVAITGRKLVMQLGYSHPVEMTIPEGLEASIEKNIITIRGIDTQLVGQFAAVIRSQRPPEPYKGKGIKYSGEIIRRKAGKVVKAAGG